MRRRAGPIGRTVARLLAVLPVLGGLTITGAAMHVVLPLTSCAQAATAHHATLVVEHSAGSGQGAGPVIRVCVPFTEDTITGQQLLAGSGVQYGTGDSGQAVCQIDSEPASYPPQCLTGSAPYWEMFVSRGGGAWAYSNAGFTSATFRDGDAEGFRFEGQSDGTTPPSPAGVCPVPTRTPTPATPPARLSTRTPSATPASSAPPSSAAAPPSATTTPSAPPTATPTARPPVSVASSNQSAPLRPSGGGTPVAIGLAAALLFVLLAQLVRTRRRSPQPPPP